MNSIGILFLFLLAGVVPQPPKQALHTIIIDPGHGGFDPGTHGVFSKEKNVTLAISLKLGRAIEKAFPDVKVIYTRTTDIMPGNAPTLHEGLRYRADMANKSKGDLFLCIHANSNGRTAGHYEERYFAGYKWVRKGRKKIKVAFYRSRKIKNMTKGTTTFIWKADWSPLKSSMISEEDMGDSTAAPIDMDSPEARIRAQLYEKKYFGNSAYFGDLVEEEFLKAGRHSFGIQQREAGIWVLEATGMPSVLIETGFLTNAEEERYLNSGKGQNEVVRNIVTALKKYNTYLAGKHTPSLP